ncbi:uncharacterized protein FMAN_06462 [Fusarium mangiferae]|uniref:Uncharacterized protein n=1 Tax=Fusarium mangiferae TaxID=192010 RepID=A0A1L7SP22_FUSMA|nr:uncharacterized protein FMAN_06462 [Fusarium mangiferae]CVK86173.1 uncharacterized protein FMAN_06462 [Fusarium mangiferae]
MARRGAPRYLSRIISKKHNPDGREKNIAWLNEKWEGLDWIPADVRAGFQKGKVSASVLRGLKAISELATERNIPLISLWEPDGCLRNAVEDGATIKYGPKSKSKPPKPWPLSRNRVLLAYQSLTSSPAEVGNVRISSPGKFVIHHVNEVACSETGVDCKEEVPEDETVGSQLSSPSPSPPAEQRQPHILHDTIASTEHELRDPSRGTKRALEDATSDSSRNKRARVTIDEVLGNLSFDLIKTARRTMEVELDTALSFKRDAGKALIDLLHRDCSVAVTQAERVQTRNRKQEADEAFRQTHERLHGPSQTLAAMSNLKKTFDAHSVRALKLENAERVVQICKDRLDKAHANHEAALKSNPIDDCDLEAVWDMFKRDDGHGKDFQ